jgi:hypothetical protein
MTADIAEGHCTTDPYVADPAKALAARRRKLRALLEASPLLMQPETLAQDALASTSIVPPSGKCRGAQAPIC